MKAWIQNLSDFQFSLLCIGLMVAGLFCLQLAFTSQTLRDMVDDAEKVVRDRMKQEAQHVPIEIPDDGTTREQRAADSDDLVVPAPAEGAE